MVVIHQDTNDFFVNTVKVRFAASLVAAAAVPPGLGSLVAMDTEPVSQWRDHCAGTTRCCREYKA